MSAGARTFVARHRGAEQEPAGPLKGTRRDTLRDPADELVPDHVVGVRSRPPAGGRGDRDVAPDGPGQVDQVVLWPAAVPPGFRSCR